MDNKHLEAAADAFNDTRIGLYEEFNLKRSISTVEMRAIEAAIKAWIGDRLLYEYSGDRMTRAELVATGALTPVDNL